MSNTELWDSSQQGCIAPWSQGRNAQIRKAELPGQSPSWALLLAALVLLWGAAAFWPKALSVTWLNRGGVCLVR